MEELRETSDEKKVRSDEENNGGECGFRAEDNAERSLQSDIPTEQEIGGGTKRNAAIKRFVISVKVRTAYFAYLIVFLITFAVMLFLLTLAAVGIPMCCSQAVQGGFYYNTARSRADDIRRACGCLRYGVLRTAGGKGGVHGFAFFLKNKAAL